MNSQHGLEFITNCLKHLKESFQDNFDLYILEEPYRSLDMMINIDTGEYILRILGTTREKGYYSNVEVLEGIIRSRFSGTATCVGNPGLRQGDRAIVEINQPFNMVVSARCPGYYRLSPGETVHQGRGCCPLCRQEIPDIQCSNQGVKEDLTSLPDNELKILSPTQPRKRGRPRIKRNQPPKTRQMSEVTKRKISENNKKFSICKICNKQCRGFRGLVDHMHRDHEDYKPWRCHICDVRTAFVKTLYRHLKQEHGASGSPCPVCGKMFTRAQSMLHHVNKHDSQAQAKEELKCGECGEMFSSKICLSHHTATHHPSHQHHVAAHHEPDHCHQCKHQEPVEQRDHRDYQIDTNFSLSPPEEDYNLLFFETALSITDDVNVLKFPFINQDQKFFDETPAVPAGTEGFVDSSVFGEDLAPLNNARISQISTTSTSANHHQRDGTVIRFCKNV